MKKLEIFEGKNKNRSDIQDELYFALDNVIQSFEPRVNLYEAVGVLQALIINMQLRQYDLIDE